MAAKKKPGFGLTAGDVLAGRVLDGRYGAVRVLRLFPRSVWLACTQYLGDAPPAITDRELRKVLRLNRFFYENERVLMVADKPPPSDFLHVGNIPLTAKDRALDPHGRYGSGWTIVEDALMEWRWEHDRAALEREVEAERAQSEAERKVARPPGPRKRTPRSRLTEADFWKLLGTIRDPDLTPLVRALAKRSVADIREFGELLAHKLYLLDTEAHAKHAGRAGTSADAFLYARCFVVAQGRAFFKGVRAEPKKFPDDVDFEALLSVAADAYTAKTGNELEGDMHYPYETGSNVTGWPGE